MALHCRPSPTAGTVQIAPCGGTHGMEPMHQPRVPHAFASPQIDIGANPKAIQTAMGALPNPDDL